MAKILCMGILCVDTIVKPAIPDIFQNDTMLIDEVAYTTGGDALNQAIILSRLGDETAIAGMIGKDMNGIRIINKLEEEHVDITHLLNSDSIPTSASFLLCEPDGERHVLYCPGTNAAFCFEDYECLKQFDIVSVGSLFGCKSMDRGGYLKLFKRIKEHTDIKIAADLTSNTMDTDPQYIKELIPYINYLCPSASEGAYITGKTNPEEIVSSLKDMNAAMILLKDGGNGCYLSYDDRLIHIPAYHGVKTIDTTGAGDNFTAAFLHAIMKGSSPEESALFATAAGALAIGAVGSTSAVWDEMQILDYIHNNERLG